MRFRLPTLDIPDELDRARAAKGLFADLSWRQVECASGAEMTKRYDLIAMETMR